MGIVAGYALSNGDRGVTVLDLVGLGAAGPAELALVGRAVRNGEDSMSLNCSSGRDF